MASRRTFGLFVAFTCSLSTALAADASPVIVRVGSASMTQADVARRLAALPSYQLARYGSTPEDQKKRFVAEVLVPEMLFGEEAFQKKLDASPNVQDKVREALRDSVDRGIREDTLKAQPITPEEIKKYYDENKARYETPKRIKVWRIQVPDEAAAKAVIGLAKGADGPKRWSEEARERSLDKATAQRSGDLGFVRPDGTTDVPRVQVDPAVYAAVDKVPDGTVVPTPLKEGDHYSVLWRRGSIEATKRTLEDESDSIRQLLERRRIETGRQELLKRLKTEQVKESHPELLEHIEVEQTAPSRREMLRDGGARRRRDGGALKAPRPEPDEPK
ncbi:MAG TPA: peptidyl-prolyl cis-trans isomerase [Polyangiaceae bacterium]